MDRKDKVVYDHLMTDTVAELVRIPDSESSPDFDSMWNALKSAALAGVPSEKSKRLYSGCLDHFYRWYFLEPRPPFGKTVVQEYRTALELEAYAPSTVAIHIASLRKLAEEAADNGLLDRQLAAGVCRVRGPRRLGRKLGNWLGIDESEALICAPDSSTLKGVRDQAILSVALGCGLRRSEIAALTLAHMQVRDSRWLIVDLVGKHRRLRTVPVPDWVKLSLDLWLFRAGFVSGRLFRSISKAGVIDGDSMTPQAIYEVVRTYGYRTGVRISPHDMRRTFAKLAFAGGAPLEQIQYALGHASITTTEIYLGLKQDLSKAPGDCIHLKLPYSKCA